MKITVVSPWYNEEIFAPFFLTLYNYADKIHIFLDVETNDGTEDICKEYDNVEIEKIDYLSRGFYDRTIIRRVNDFVAKLKSDWVIVVASDEFIFPRNNESARAVLGRQTANLLKAKMWQTWKHITETDLDLSKPSVYQRRHGQLLPHRRITERYNKPIIAKPKSGVQWLPGAHKCMSEKEPLVLSGESFIGAHWKHADIERAIAKRRERLKRMKGIRDRGVKDPKLIRGALMEDFKIHLEDPQMF